MMNWARSFEGLRAIALAAIVAIAGGCATSPPAQSGTQPSAPPTTGKSAKVSAAAPAFYSDGGSPMSSGQLVESAQFADTAIRHGFTPTVRDGVTVYCWTDKDIGSLIPSKKCVNRERLELMLQQRQRQRASMQQGSFGCTPGSMGCAH